MLKPKQPTATYAEIERLPPNVVGKIIFGAIYTHPRPSPRHGVAASEKRLLAATFKNDDPVTAPLFEAHTFSLSVVWAGEA